MQPSLRQFFALIAVCALAGVFLGLLLFPDVDYTHRYPPPRAAQGSLYAKFAGDYYLGNGLGSNLYLSILADGRYSFFESGCGGIYDRERGYAHTANGELYLEPTHRGRLLRRAFVPVFWGNKAYLVPSQGMQALCDAIVTGDEPRNDPHGDFFLLGAGGAARGVPPLPPRWAAYLAKELLLGNIVAIESQGRVRVNLGSADGLEPGHGLIVQGREERRPRTLAVISVESHFCLAEDDPGENDRPLILGDYVVIRRPIQHSEGLEDRE